MQAIVRGLRCVVATQNYQVGDVVLRQTASPTKAIHHSCTPNAILKDRAIIATSPIHMGTEITLNFTEMSGQAFIVQQKQSICLDCGSILTGSTTICDKVWL